MFDWLGDFFAWLVVFAKSCVLTLLDMFKDLFLWVVEQVLTLVMSLLNTLPLGDLTAYTPQSWVGSLGGEVINILGLIGAGECLGIIVTALVVRFFLLMIPMVRWGS